jgi:hypothetical protein
MSYNRKFVDKTKEEMEECLNVYGHTFREEVYAWLDRIVGAAEQKDKGSVSTLDFGELLEAAANTKPKNWQLSWKRWLTSPLQEKAKAVWHVIRNRKPPWELRSAARWFVLLGSIPAEIVAFYEVDHLKKIVIFRYFEGLPGQG